MTQKMKYEKIVPTNNYPYKIFSFQTDSPDRLIPPHWHESGELLFCLSGQLEVIFSNVTHQLKTMDMLFINSNQVHSSRTPTPSNCLAIQFPLEYLQLVTEDEYLKKILFDSTPIIKNVDAIACLKFISQNFSTKDLAKRLQVKSKVYELLAILCNHYMISSANLHDIKSAKNLEKMKQVNQYIMKHYVEDLSLKEVAEVFNYNPSYFSRFYKKFMGITFTAYVNSIRLEAAYKELRDTDQTILEISLNSGFSNVKTFYNAFYKNFELSPHQYRRRYFKKK